MTQGLDASGSVVRRWQLAAALKAHREQAELTQEQVIERLTSAGARWSRSKLSRVENREHHLKPREVKQLLDAYGVTDTETRDALVQLAVPSRERGWWNSFGKTFSDDLQTLMSLESGLVALRDFQNQLVHGLLQTGDYTRALAMSINPGRFSAAELERAVAARMARQQIIAKNSLPHLHFILDETIMQRPVGDRIVMHDQMRKLLHATEKPNVSIQVLPLAAGASSGLEGPFLTHPARPDAGHRIHRGQGRDILHRRSGPSARLRVTFWHSEQLCPVSGGVRRVNRRVDEGLPVSTREESHWMPQVDRLAQDRWPRAASPTASTPTVRASRWPRCRMAGSPYATATTPTPVPCCSPAPRCTPGSRASKPASSTTSPSRSCVGRKAATSRGRPPSSLELEPYPNCAMTVTVPGATSVKPASRTATTRRSSQA